MIQIIIGFISGIVSGFGMGGGTILILLLTLFLGIDQHTAQSANLIFFIPTAIAACFINFKQKNIKIKLGLKIILFGIIGAIVGSVISSRLDVKILRKLFAIFLLIIAFYEIISWYKKYIKNKNKA